MVSSSLTAGACPANKCGTCVIDDPKTKKWCTICYKSKVTGADKDTTCEGTASGIAGCLLSRMEGTTEKCLTCEDGKFGKDASKTDCSISCTLATQFYNSQTFACVTRTKFLSNCSTFASDADECQICSTGYSISGTACEPLSAVTNCITLSTTNKANCV